MSIVTRSKSSGRVVSESANDKSIHSNSTNSTNSTGSTHSTHSDTTNSMHSNTVQFNLDRSRSCHTSSGSNGGSSDSDSTVFDESDIIKPIFNGGSYFSSAFSLRMFYIGLFAIIMCEVIGGNMKITAIMPSQVISHFGTFVSNHVTNNIGYFVGYISDFQKFLAYAMDNLKNMINFLKNVVFYHFTKIANMILIDPITRICGALFGAMYENFSAFWSNFGSALGQNAIFAYVVGIVIIAIGSLIFLTSFETFGRRNKINMIRPSSILVGFANMFYKVAEKTSFSFGIFSNFMNMIFTGFFTFLNTVFPFVEPYIRPYVRQMQNSFTYISIAFGDVIKGPIVGAYNGLKMTAACMRRNFFSCLMCAIIVSLFLIFKTTIPAIIVLMYSAIVMTIMITV